MVTQILLFQFYQHTVMWLKVYCIETCAGKAKDEVNIINIGSHFEECERKGVTDN